MRQFTMVLLALGLAAARVCAQDTSALINQALDKPFKFGDTGAFKDSIPKVIQEIRNKTGVQFKVDPAVWDLLPWGQDTLIRGTLENVTLRDALGAITRNAGLTFVVRGEYVEIQPQPALRRLGQRATANELRALDILSSKPMELGTDRPTIKALLEAVDEKLAAVKDGEQFAIENRMGDVPELKKQIYVPRNATPMEALESIPKETRFTWYPWGKNILVVSKEDRTLKLLSRPLTIPMPEQGMDVLQLLTEIATETGVPFTFQPGMMQGLPAGARTLRARFQDASAQQILEVVMAATGLSYAVADDKVEIRSAGPAAATAAREATLGLLQLDNGMTVLVPASQVPADIQEYLKYQIEKQMRRIRQQMTEEGFKPTTRPGEP